MTINRETAPNAISDDVLIFASDLGAGRPVHVAISTSLDAHLMDRAENLDRQCRQRGGIPTFGRAIFSADDLYLVGEFHCVVSTPQGLVDVTPSPTGETQTLFAPYPTLTDGAGLHRLNIRARVYGAAEKRAELELKLVAASEADQASARKNGITVRQLLLSRLPRDPFAIQIDDYLRAEGKLEAAILAAHDGTRDWDPSRLEGIQAESQRLDRRRRDLYQAADRARNERSETRKAGEGFSA
jgi:hypothetical protein